MKQKSQTKPDSDAARVKKSCNWCDKNWHTEEECYGKKTGISKALCKQATKEKKPWSKFLKDNAVREYEKKKDRKQKKDATGAEMSCVSEGVPQKITRKLGVQPVSVAGLFIKGVGEQQIQVRKSLTVIMPTNIKGKSIKNVKDRNITFAVADTGYEMIVATDNLRQMKILNKAYTCGTIIIYKL